jgi:3',5'-cyclic AMP phosphodiesterase CpdA
MAEFRLTQISDTHLARHLPTLTENFHCIAEHIDATRPDLVLNSGDITFDVPGNCDDLAFAKSLHAGLPVDCLYLPGNHDIGDNPTAVGEPPKTPASEEHRDMFRKVVGEDHWCFEAAGWCFIGLNSLIMNTGLPSEDEQFDWLAGQLANVATKPVALFLHKPLYLDLPDEPELAASAIRYVPQPARSRLIEMFGKVDWRLVGSGHVHQRRDFTHLHVRHVWAPSGGFIIPDRMQEMIASGPTVLRCAISGRRASPTSAWTRCSRGRRPHKEQ